MKNLTNYIERKFQNEIRSHKTIDPVPGDLTPLPEELHPDIRDVLIEQGITKLYSHQKEAFSHIASGKDTLLVSSTASGKTLSFFLPILNDYLATGSTFSVLLLYPTKALSRDQESTFGKLMKVVKRAARLGTFDGDTPREERVKIQSSADFVITNPDMLHGGILPNNHRRWKSFLSRLKYIVVDEVHSYRGAFGSHVSNVFRRLLRVCAMHGSNPIFVCSSATIGNPGEQARALFHREFHVITKDGAPKPRKEIYFINPQLVKSQGDTWYRKGTSSVSVPLIIEAAKKDIRTICFCRARQEAERLYKSVIDYEPSLKDIVKPYRGGLLPSERRQLERDLFSGKLKVIISTNALELGIDIGDLDLCLLSGHPGTLASFHQQAGRVGRKQNDACIVYIARNKPIDQYLVHHVGFLFSRPIEQAWLNADNPYILLQHLPCAASEVPLRTEEKYYDPEIYTEALEILKKEKTVVPYQDSFRYALQDYPARGVNLRGMTDYNIEIIHGTTVIGEIDPIGARGTLYKDAIYQHLGTRYVSMDLDLEKKICKVERVDADYYTEAVWEGRVELTSQDEHKETAGPNGGLLEFGGIHVNKQPKLYKKIRERSFENIGYGPITLPPFEYDTTGFRVRMPKAWIDEIAKLDRKFIGAAFYGLSYLLKNTAPALCMADINDISTDVSIAEAEDQLAQSALYLFDSIEGGVGYSEKIFEKFDDSLKICESVLTECECENGCPSCVPPLPPGIDDDDLQIFFIESNASKECTRSLLSALVHGRIVQPRISIVKREMGKAVEPEPENPEKVLLKKKLGRAAVTLRKKREKLH